jgi:recombination protein RecR
MMFEPPIQVLIDELARLPGIGRKSAQRLAFHLLHVEEEDARRLAEAIPQDIVVVERTQEFRGRYHVLGGSISPIEGVGPDQLRMRELAARIDDEKVTEVIVATNPTVEGDTTALYLARILKPLGVRVTRLASGLPVGGDLDYADELTLGRALVGRREM